MDPHHIGLDFAKILVEVYGVDGEGTLVVRKRATKNEIKVYLSRLRPCMVGLEACGNAHHWAQELGSLGHDVRLVQPHITASYSGQNSAACDNAEALCRAVAGLPERSDRTISTVLGSMRSIFLRSDYGRAAVSLPPRS